MLGTIYKIWKASPEDRRRQALDDIRRQTESCGYTLDGLTDSQLEAAVTAGEGGIEKIPPMTGRMMYWMLRQISPDVKQLRRRKIKPSVSRTTAIPRKPKGV